MSAFTCDTCGALDHVLLDGYDVGDRLLEGVMFTITRRNDGTVLATMPTDSYTAGLNRAKWERAMAEYAAETDTATCPHCGADVDAPGVKS